MTPPYRDGAEGFVRISKGRLEAIGLATTIAVVLVGSWLLGRNRSTVVTRSESLSEFVTVPASPLWTDTKVDIATGDSLFVYHAEGEWVTGRGIPRFGPERKKVSNRGYLADEWITNGKHGELIGCIVEGDTNPNDFPRVISQNDSRLFEVGGTAAAPKGKTGRLWLGINDGWRGNSHQDNSGSIRALYLVGRHNSKR